MIPRFPATPVGAQNTATGISALTSNTGGLRNTGNGAYALANNTTGNENTANGMFALFSNTDGSFNTANGSQALYSNTTGTANTANGWQALLNNNSVYNTADGFQALYSNTTGQFNTATGAHALCAASPAKTTVANGFEVLGQETPPAEANTAIGSSCVHLATLPAATTRPWASSAGNGVTTANHGDLYRSERPEAARTSSITIHMIGSVYGVTTQSGTTAPVVVSDATAASWELAASSERFKKDIAYLWRKASEAILSLRPVTFHTTKERTLKGTFRNLV